jgi:hypothetical protein
VLKGALDDFALTDIFRLISLAKKTGRLEVFRQAGRGAVFFNEGDVYYAESSLVREPLGQKLIRAGALTEGQLRRALDQHAATGHRLGRVLLSSGWVSDKDLEDAVRGQTEDAVFDLLRWEVGEFRWDTGEFVDVEVRVAVSVENLIMEASRRLDEMDIITRKIPSIDAVMAMAAKPPEGAVEINITPDEWRLLVLVDGSRSVGAIAATVGVDDFDAMKTVFGLLSAGLVEVVSTGLEEQDLGEPGTPEGLEDELEATTPEEVPAAMPSAPEPATGSGFASGPGVPPEPELAREVQPAAEPTGEVQPAAEPTGESAPVTEAGEEVQPVTEPAAPEFTEPLAPAEDPFRPEHEVALADDSDPELETTFVDEAEESAPPQPVAEEWVEEGEAAAPAAPEGATGEEPAAGGLGLHEEGVEPPDPAEPRLEALLTAPAITPEDEVEPDLTPAGPDVAVDEEVSEPELAPAGPDLVLQDEASEPESAEQDDAASEPDRESEPPEAPRLERSAAVRELAGLWGDPQQPVRRPARDPGAAPAPGEPDARKRVEDDEDINRGLISKLIDGVKGL